MKQRTIAKRFGRDVREERRYVRRMLGSHYRWAALAMVQSPLTGQVRVVGALQAYHVHRMTARIDTAASLMASAFGSALFPRLLHVSRPDPRVDALRLARDQ